MAASVERYGPEVYGFLVARLRDEDLANDAFAAACEDLCTTASTFAWRCSMRTWFYKLARSAATREGLRRRRGHVRDVALSDVSELADQVSSRTRDYLRTAVKDGFVALREELDPDDQMLLVLRVDRALDWAEVAEVLADGDLDAAESARAAARLRQRFKTLKEQLRKRAIEVGLVPAEE